MGRKYFADAQILGTGTTAEAVSADKTTASFPIQGVDVAGFTFKWSSGVSLAGTFTLQVSFDGKTWFDLETGTVTLSGASGQMDVEITENRYSYCRGFFDISAGTANFLGWYSASSKGN